MAINTIGLWVLTQSALSTDVGSNPAASSGLPASPTPEKEDILKSVPIAPDELNVKDVTDNVLAPIDPIISPGQQGALKTSPITSSIAPSAAPNPEKEAVLVSVAEPNAVHPNVAQLEKRIAVLEDEVQALLAKQGKPSQVKAPFEVVDDKGNLLMKISNDALGTRLLMYSPETQNTVSILAGTRDSRVALTSTSGANSSVIKASEDGSGVEVHNADIHAVLGSGDDGRDGLIINSPGVMPTTPATAGSGQMVAEISTQTGKKLALRLFDDKGILVVSAGSNPLAAGAGTVRVANTKGEPVAFLGTSEDGESGALGVAKKGKNTAALLSEPRMVVLYNDAGQAITTLAKSQEGTGEGGNITIRQPDGEGIFSAGYSSEGGGGEACVYRAKKQNVFCLGIAVPGMGTGH